MALLIGPSGSGKTLLLKRLQAYKVGASNNKKEGEEFDPLDIPSTIPTVGINLVNLSLGKKQLQDVMLREIGGTMAPLWKDYYKESKVCLFVIDLSNSVQVSAATMQLIDTLNDENMKGKPILLLLNKVDAPCKMSTSELDSIIPISNIIKFASQSITTLEISASTGVGVTEVVKWLQRNI